VAKIVLQTFGSLGDLHPTLALAIELKARGHDVTIATHEIYRLKVRRERLGFQPMPPDFAQGDDLEEMYRRTMDGAKGSEYVLRHLCLPSTHLQFDALVKVARGADLLVAHPLGYATPVVAEHLGIPWVSTALQPMILFSTLDPSVYPTAPWATPLLRMSPALGRLFFKMGRAQTRGWMKPVDDLRKAVGLPPARAHPAFEGMISPLLHLCLFSGALAESQADWPRSAVQTGFLFYDKDEDGSSMPQGLVEYLDAGPPPVVFTLGSSAVMVAGNFYWTSARAAAALGRRAVLLIGRDPRNRWPDPWPGDVGVFEYAAYSQLFPRAAAIVHQGGAGTTAQALRAGRPMIVVPFAHDQPDHAARIVRRGLGRTIPRFGYDEERVTRTLRAVLEDREMAERAEAAGRRVRAEIGAQSAADAVESALVRARA
jgi:UDP:flavonoid glycosyltransferase YjiC (YdhE family)